MTEVLNWILYVLVFFAGMGGWLLADRDALLAAQEAIAQAEKNG